MLGTSIITADYYYHVQNEYLIDGNQEKFADRSVYEDGSNANSYGPLYSGLDHFKYFDVNHLQCLTDALEVIAIPIVFQPTDILPPLPEHIQIKVRAIGDLPIRFLNPVF